MKKKGECTELASFLSPSGNTDRETPCYEVTSPLFSHDFLSFFAHPSLAVIWSFPPSVKVGRIVIMADQQLPYGFQADHACIDKTSSNTFFKQ